MKHLALLLLAAACQPAKAPTARDVATTAVVLTDDALAVAIATAPEPFDAPVWEDRVAWLEQAADAVHNGRSICPHVKALAAVAQGVACQKCIDAIEVARKAIPCP